MASTSKTTKVFVLRDTRVDARGPGEEDPKNQSVAVGDIVSLLPDNADLLVQTGCARYATPDDLLAKAPVKLPKPAGK